MQRRQITISDNGTVTVPPDIRMTIAEIADLFGVFYQTAKGAVRAIEKLGVADGDYSMCCVVGGTKVYPEYYGLEMITALAFRVQSHRAEIFRGWVIKRCAETRDNRQTILLQYDSSASIN